MSTERVFIWVAHPAGGSFNAALADAYEEGAKANGAIVRRMDLADMEFASEFTGYRDAPELEPDLRRWQTNVAWADRILIVHPLWWSAMPARAKALLDRALTPGFAYKYRAKGVAWDKLLDGKTGDAIITADTPTWVDNWIYRKPSRKVLAKGVYDFCGIKPRQMAHFGSIKMSDDAQRAKWLAKAAQMGAKAAKLSRPAEPDQQVLEDALVV